MKTPDGSSFDVLRSRDAELQQHLAKLANERDIAYRALEDRDAELALMQRIAGVGGGEVDLREGFRNRRSPAYLIIHGLPPATSAAPVTGQTPEEISELILLRKFAVELLPEGEAK